MKPDGIHRDLTPIHHKTAIQPYLTSAADTVANHRKNENISVIIDAANFRTTATKHGKS
jgi:hypothetical protein